MGIEHNHNFRGSKERSLLIALLLTSIFFIAEIIGSILTGSLALLSDATHMLTDLIALIIAWTAIKIGQRPADSLRTFGYYRFEILAAAFNTILLFLAALYILYEAYQRFFIPPEIYSKGMLIIAGFGLIINLISMRLLASDKDKSLNIKSAYLEVWSDMLSSVGVIIGALIIQITHWVWIDSIVAVLIGLWILPRSWVLLKESINVLLEGVPKGVDIKKLKKLALEVEGVLDIHELHVWGITSDKISLTAHVIIDSRFDCETVSSQLRQLLASQFGITHTTLQHEREKCHDKDTNCHF